MEIDFAKIRPKVDSIEGTSDSEPEPEPERSEPEPTPLLHWRTSPPVAKIPALDAQVYTVAALTHSIRRLLESSLGEVWVEGEISNLRRQASGHHYFTLKDEKAQLSCVMFRSAAATLRRPLTDGMKVQAYGFLTVYDARGQYQLVVEIVQAKGLGDLQARFEALKQKLFTEGLFAADRKKPLPRFPRRIGIVTSPTGAAIRDMLNILARRAPWLEVVIAPVRVQGEGAALEVAQALDQLNSWQADRQLDLDLIVVGRGGGSLEDLWAFNEEVLARAIARSELPVVSAVGHEIDLTISDLVADLRAPTPSAAAELIVPEESDLLRQIARFQQVLLGQLKQGLSLARARVERSANSALLRDPLRLVREQEMRVDYLEERLDAILRTEIDRRQGQLRELRWQLTPAQLTARLESARERIGRNRQILERVTRECLQEKRNRFGQIRNAMRILGPDATLQRGFTMTFSAEGKLLTSVKAAEQEERLVTKFADGEIESVQAKKNRAG